MIKVNQVYRPPKKIKDNKPSTETVTTIQEWLQYAKYLAERNKIPEHHHELFIYTIINNIDTPVLILPKQPNTILNETEIQEAVEKKHHELLLENNNEKQHIKKIIDYIITLFIEDIQEYEKVTHRFNLKLTPEQVEVLQTVPGKTNREKVSYLLDKSNKWRKQIFNYDTEPTKRVTVTFTESDYRKFKDVEGKNNSEKLAHLL